MADDNKKKILKPIAPNIPLHRMIIKLKKFA